MAPSKVIPIVLLHHGQPEVLLRTVEHISANTRHPYILFVVDNATPADDLLKNTFSIIQEKYKVHIIHNKNNNWIYGFNLAMEHEKWPDSEFYAFSDADILVPADQDGICWLGKMVDQLEQHRCIGKLGLSLDLSELQKNTVLQATFLAEKRLLLGEKIGNNIIAPVDTTMAVYRKDFFIGKFKFRIGHQSLARPYYYICRTDPSLSAIHVGWDFYPGASKEEYPLEKQWIKAMTMCKMGTYVAPEVIQAFGFVRRLQLRCLQAMVRSVHGFKLLAMVLFYVVKRLPRRLNELQSKAR